jgi:hypothetical protein
MPKSVEYRAKEREAAEFAKRMSLHSQRDQYLAIAGAWRELAERAEAQERAEKDDDQAS